jgi:PAS domain S-box-containing protein
MPDSTIDGKEAQLRCLVDANIVGVMISTTDRVIDANDHYLQMIGYTRADLVDGLVPWQELTPPEWRAATETAAAEVREHGARIPYEKELGRRDGTRVPVLVSCGILEHEPRAFIWSVLDLTRTKKLEAALYRAEEEAERSNEAVRSFVSTMRHDLRSPLNVVLGFGQLLQLDELDTNQRESVEQILTAANQLLTLINETLDLSRIEGKPDSR